MAGFYPVDHGDMDHAVFGGTRRFNRWEAYCWLLDHAAFDHQTTTVNGKPVKLDRGQIALSVGSLAKAWKWPKSSVQRFLEGLEREGFIVYLPAVVLSTDARTNARTDSKVITLCKYYAISAGMESSGSIVRTDERTNGETAPYSESSKKVNNRRKPLRSGEVIPRQPDLLGGDVVELPPNDVQMAFDSYRAVAKELRLAVPHDLETRVGPGGPTRRSALRLRLQENGGLSGWALALEALRNAKFITSGGWKGFSLDDMVTRKKLEKLMAGGYNNLWQGGTVENPVERDMREYYEQHPGESFFHQISPTGKVKL